MEELNLTDLFKYFLKHFSVIIFVTALSIMIGTAYVLFLQTPLYKSSTTLILVQSDKKSDSDLALTQTEININQKLVSTYSQIVKSRRVLKKVIKNLDSNLSTGALSQKITVSAIENTEIIKISVSDEDNKEAAKIANEIANVFSDEVAKIYQMENISIIDKAEVESVPYNVQIIKQEVMYFGIGFVLSCMILFVAFYFDTKIKTSEQVEEKFDLMVLGSIPKVKKAGDL